MVQQLLVLARDIQAHQSTRQKKLLDLPPTKASAPTLSAASHMLQTVEGEPNAALGALPGGSAKPKAPTAAVRGEPPPRPALQALEDTTKPVLVLLGSVAPVVILLVIRLSQRGQLRDRLRDRVRDRLLRLAGDARHRMADALTEAGRRVGRDPSMHLLVNLGCGLPLGLG